jgi:hypothetical protein
MALRLQIPAARDHVASVQINGKPAPWHVMDDQVQTPRIEITAPPADKYEIAIEWRGSAPTGAPAPMLEARDAKFVADVKPAQPTEIADPQHAVDGVALEAGSVRAKTVGVDGNRTVFAKVRQGDLSWWMPIAFEVREPLEIVGAQSQLAGHLAFRVRNSTANTIDRDVTAVIGGQSIKVRLQALAGADSTPIDTADGAVPGTNHVAVEIEPGIRAVGDVVNWNAPANTAAKFEPVDLSASFNDRVTQIFRNQYFSPRSPYLCTLAVPSQGFGTWCHPKDTFDVNDAGLRAAASAGGGRVILPQGIPFLTTGTGAGKNIAFTSRWDNYPPQVQVPLAGRSSHAYLLMAGSTHPMASRIDNGEVIIRYADGSTDRLALANPTTWWPIDQDYKMDDFSLAIDSALPPRVDLKTGTVRVLDAIKFRGEGRKVDGGAATVLDLALDSGKELRSVTVRTLANEVVIGLMSVTLVRP